MSDYGVPAATNEPSDKPNYLEIDMLEDVRMILGQALSLGDRANSLTAESALLGQIPELDSMAVVTILTALEDAYGFTVEDDEISAETFATLGDLVAYVEEKVKG